MKNIPRNIEENVKLYLDSFPVVYINGPRQAGKTTFARSLLNKSFNGKYVTFDDLPERNSATLNPVSYLRDLGYPVVIDEVQMVPEIFRPIKMLVDEQRYDALQSKKKKSADGHYLLTGSANLMMLPALADAMVGRMGTITLLPFSVGEILGKKSKFIERCFAKDFAGVTSEKEVIPSLIRKATFPEISDSKQNQVDEWFRNYIRKITLEDPRQIYNLEKATFMPILLQMLAARAGNLVNDADLSRDSGLNAVTAKIYRNLLSGTFVTHYLTPWYRNTTKRLVKASKIFFYDTMLLCHVLGETPETLAKNNPQNYGHILENFVFTELMKMNSSSSKPVNISFYRTRDNVEVDFVLERHGKLVGIEVKNAENIGNKDLAGLREFRNEAKKEFLCGIVLCNTPRVMRVDDDIFLVPLNALWQ